eukprot:GHVR01047362.1.p1 GENE.GHVR01047362.1~~GHVR01047362.1.p1  ORF type:complete len:208 (-),score=44.28 GHVR01047362.1:77-700(-)
MSEDTHVKIVMIGDATVGKTHLLSRYVKGTLPKAPAATVGVEFATRTVPLMTGGTIKAQIWDTAGQERYRAITAAHYRRAVGAVLVYDVTRKDTFDSLQNWLDELRGSAEPDVTIIVVGNKQDRCSADPNIREVTEREGKFWAERRGLLWVEASAVTSLNVKHIFETLLQEIYNKQSQVQRDVNADGDSTKVNVESSSCGDNKKCCS